MRTAVFLLPLAFLPNIVDEFVLPKLLLARLLSGYVLGAVGVLQSNFGILGGGFFPGPNGVIRASATMANPDFLGIFLAMLFPVAFAKTVSRRPITARLLAASLALVLILGLL